MATLMTLYRPRVGCILDEFTYHCFFPECELIVISKQNWIKVLEQPLDFILCESAWKAYQSNISLASTDPHASKTLRWLKSVLFNAKKHNIPTVFWNKEDNLHFYKFLHIAKLFEYIFTTDERCIPKYRKECPNCKNVDTLLFAANPKLHNPIHLFRREYAGDAFFAGTWYKGMATRNQELFQLLNISDKFRVDIYDRRYHVSNSNTPDYPRELWPRVLPGVEYTQILEKYSEYPVMFNVNTVRDSPSMFSRRVPEALACGTSVISSPSISLQNYFLPSNIFYSKSKKETEKHLSYILENRESRRKDIIDSVRHTLIFHSYRNRVLQICRSIGVKEPEYSDKMLAIVFRSDDDKKNIQIYKEIKEQVYANIVKIISISLEDNNTLDYLRDLFLHHYESHQQMGQIDNIQAKKENIGIVSFFYPGNRYGKYYASDQYYAFQYTNADVIGKGCVLVKTSPNQKEKVVSPHLEHTFTDDLHPHTLSFSLLGSYEERENRLNYLLSTLGYQGEYADTPGILEKYSTCRDDFIYCPEESTPEIMTNTALVQELLNKNVEHDE